MVLLGPTGSGKTALSLRLARQFAGEIVSCDSVAVYRDFEIGTAKPTAAERRSVPHHLIDCVSPEQTYSAGAYSRDARRAIEEIRQRGRLPIVTGGTGLYLRALLYGLFAGPERSEELRGRLRRAEERHAKGWLHRVLQRLDPAAAASIHANDLPKLIRAIEVSFTLRQPMSEAWNATGSPTHADNAPLESWRILRIGLQPERQQLYSRINARAEAMFDRGLVEETRMLMERYRPDLRVFEALGYRQARAHMMGTLTLNAAIASAQQGHRNYAKRQMTWFRREPDVIWLDGFGDEERVAQAAEQLIARCRMTAAAPPGSAERI